MGREDELRVRLQLLTWPLMTSLAPSAWPALDWLDIERNENQSRKMTFSGIKQFASSCRDPGTHSSPQLEGADLPGYYVGLTSNQ